MMQQNLADAGAVVSVAAAGWTWVATANELAQLVATVIAIISGLAAGAYHIHKLWRERK